jgi:hypothetical protein
VFSKLVVSVMVIAWLGACITPSGGRKSDDGNIIPPRPLLRFSNPEYLCEPLQAKEPKAIERLLNQYGREGWRLAALSDDGESGRLVCFER